jgi:putative transposase
MQQSRREYPALFDRILNDCGIDIVLTGVRMPRMNSIMERWVRTCRANFSTGH